MTKFFMPLVLGALIAAPVLAGPVRDSEAQLRQAYGDYRAALFLSNQGKAPETKAALDRFIAEWDTIARDWVATPPPQYADDAELGASVTQVSELAAKAEEKLAEGALPETHETLEGIRDVLGDLHARNGIISFSDRMNAYHAVMEEVLGRDYAAMGEEGRAELIADASLLSYLAGQIVKNRAPEAAASDSYQKLVDGLAVSTAFFYDAAMSGDVARALAARGNIKPAYAMLFAKFG